MLFVSTSAASTPSPASSASSRTFSRTLPLPIPATAANPIYKPFRLTQGHPVYIQPTFLEHMRQVRNDQGRPAVAIGLTPLYRTVWDPARMARMMHCLAYRILGG
ncbi:hypothetical protein B0T25DRAFT_514019 [Lasiosphaeria hispida]|uniref:Uncharacterized protein n=1 Tax=Lasiosphaeria hispida TaxID=260671 RepID=A0AAJ0HXA2_9PEZI|nr:hypothetical protein B0T25DRAFT_514019 [Lasiosphaeria hispida]